jgi:16S rRNA (uracil1498-N3)-methyltransferase
MAERYFTDVPLSPGEFTLAGPDAHHLAAVKRAAPSDRVTLFNGDGHEYPAEVLAVGKKHVTLMVLSREAVSREPPFPVVVGSALPKGDRADYLIEKLVEVGATRFVPLITTRSVVQPREAKTDKLTRAVVEASKQCGRNVLMAVDPPLKLADYLTRPDLPPAKFLLHTSGGDDPSHPTPGVAVAVGPEGGFTDDEVRTAEAAGWRTISFGPRVLRVETAAAVAAAWAAGLIPPARHTPLGERN